MIRASFALAGSAPGVEEPWEARGASSVSFRAKRRVRQRRVPARRNRPGGSEEPAPARTVRSTAPLRVKRMRDAESGRTPGRRRIDDVRQRSRMQVEARRRGTDDAPARDTRSMFSRSICETGISDAPAPAGGPLSDALRRRGDEIRAASRPHLTERLAAARTDDHAVGRNEPEATTAPMSR